MKIRVIAFARARELLGSGAFEIDLPAGATLRDACDEIIARAPEMRADRSIRFAVNGVVREASHLLIENDEIAVLPPVGGG